jgi:UDP-N-acetylglucosamine/UDP-N-acetylgalactosamine diphosphorylase
MYLASAVKRKPLFACLADWILASQKRWGKDIPWYIMTSPLNHDATVAFFREHGFFGLKHGSVMFFPQGVMPSLDMKTGKILMEAPGVVATNPDGHGGSLRALAHSGALADMKDRGIEHISYVQIDNPLARVIDPVFIGLHAAAPDSSGEMSSKMVEKTQPGEKVGVFARVGGTTQVLEYSDLPRELAEARDQGQPGAPLKFNAGSIAIHMIGVEFVARLNESGSFGLPYHRAEKKVPCIDMETGKEFEPQSPNAVKLETFVFDALPLCKGSIVMETGRVEEFAPIKNADGADSPRTCTELQTLRAARWLEAAGVTVPYDAGGRPECVLEISPLTAMDPEDLRRPGAGLPKAIQRGQELAL